MAQCASPSKPVDLFPNQETDIKPRGRMKQNMNENNDISSEDPSDTTVVVNIPIVDHVSKDADVSTKFNSSSSSPSHPSHCEALNSIKSNTISVKRTASGSHKSHVLPPPISTGVKDQSKLGVSVVAAPLSAPASTTLNYPFGVPHSASGLTSPITPGAGFPSSSEAQAAHAYLRNQMDAFLRWTSQTGIASGSKTSTPVVIPYRGPSSAGLTPTSSLPVNIPLASPSTADPLSSQPTLAVTLLSPTPVSPSQTQPAGSPGVNQESISAQLAPIPITLPANIQTAYAAALAMAAAQSNGLPSPISPLSNGAQKPGASEPKKKSMEGRSFFCDYEGCGKAFVQLAHLKIHKVCSYEGCDKSFSQLGNLRTHERKHTGEKPYKCQYPGCDKTFSQLGNMKTHELLHRGVKPFVCGVDGCTQSFSQMGNLKNHKIKVHFNPRETKSTTPSSASSETESRKAKPSTTTRKRRRAVSAPQGAMSSINECEESVEAKQAKEMEEKQSKELRILMKLKAVLNRQGGDHFGLDDSSEDESDFEEPGAAQEQESFDCNLRLLASHAEVKEEELEIVN